MAASPEAKKPRLDSEHEQKKADSVKKWEKFIAETSVKDILKITKGDSPKPLVTLDPKTNIKTALELLNGNQILSAPVISPLTNDVMGFVDVLDIAAYILDLWMNNTKQFSSRFSKERDYAKSVFFDSLVEEVINYSGVDPVVKVNEGDTLKHVLHVFAKPSRHRRLHRIAVVKNERLTNILSQSDLIAFFCHLAQQGNDPLPLHLSHHSLAELHLIHPPLMLRLDATLDFALQFLNQNRVSGIALVDEQGRIAGNFSASDLRGINQSAFKYFTSSLLQFLVKGTKQGVTAPISCPGDATILDAIQLMTKHHVHRVYTTHDANGHLAGVVTMGDIIYMLSLID